jgi:hypothetical protein
LQRIPALWLRPVQYERKARAEGNARILTGEERLKRINQIIVPKPLTNYEQIYLRC